MSKSTAVRTRARIHLSPPHLGGGELGFVREAFEGNWVAPAGPHLDAFEAEFSSTMEKQEALALVSGTASLHLALRCLRIGAGDDVLVSSFTFGASAFPIVYEHATPVFIDASVDTWCMDPALLEEALARADRKGRLPKAAIVVDLYGQCADYRAIVPICQRYEIPIVEDAAEAVGATCLDRPAGAFGLLNVFSFNGNKIITTSGGGMLASRDPELIRQARHLATQARDPAHHYEHSEIGYNYRLSNVLAGIGRGQLRVLPDRVAARRRIFSTYRARLGDLPGVGFMPEAGYGQSTRWLTCITIDRAIAGTNREAVRLALAEENIESRPVWKPLHLQPVFSGCRVLGGDVSTGLFDQGLCLPSGSSMTDDDLDRVCRAVRACWREK